MQKNRIVNVCVRTLSLCTMAAMAMLSLHSCVDESYDLDNISGEITLGGEEVIIPLGTIETISLKDMFGEANDFLIEQDGIYTLKFEGQSEKITIDGFTLPVLSNVLPKIDQVTFWAPSLPNDFIFSKATSDFVMNYPNMDVAPEFSPIEFTAGVDLNLGVDIPSGSIAPALGKLSFSNSGKTTFPASFDMPAQIRSVGKIYFGTNSDTRGSKLEVKVSFNGLKSINGGGKLNLKIIFPSNYQLVDADGNSIGNRLEYKNYNVQAGVESVTLTAWLQSIDFSQKSISRGAMNINDEISYEFDYSFESVKGYCDVSRTPQIALRLSPKYRDMEIEINDIVIDNENHTSDIVYTLNGIPESIESINYIALESAPLTMRVEGLSWLKSDALTAETQLPACFILEQDANGWLDRATNTIVAPMRQLEKGVTFNLKGIDCTKGEFELKSGQLVIKASIKSHISDLKGGTRFMLSEVLPDTPTVKIKTVIDESHMFVDLAESDVRLKEQYFDFKLDERNMPRLEHTIEVPDELVEINRLEVSTPEGEKVKIKLGISHPEDEVFPVDKVYLSLSVNFKQLIHPVEGQRFIEKAANGDYILRLDHIEWRPNEKSQLDVVEIAVDAIENLPAITGEKGSRKIVIDEKFAVTGGVSIEAGTNINLEAEGAKLNFDFEIDDVQVSKFYGKLDYSFQPDNIPAIELGEMAGQGVTIDNLAVDPIIRFNVNNPVNIPFDASLSLKPFDANGNYLEDNRIDVEGVHIKGDGETHFVVSTRNRRDEYAAMEGVTFVEVDLNRMLSGTLPSKIEVVLNVASDLSTTHIIDLAKPKYELEYDYSVEIPLEFGHEFDIHYQTEIGDLAGKMEFDSPSLPITKVGEVALIADFTTTIPLDFVLETECVDENGDYTDVQVIFGSEHMIHGHHPEDAEPEAHSSLVLKLDLGEDGDLKRLAEIDAIRLRMNMRNNSHTPSGLSPDQTLSGRLRLRIRDGVTVDLGDVIPPVGE